MVTFINGKHKKIPLEYIFFNTDKINEFSEVEIMNQISLYTGLLLRILFVYVQNNSMYTLFSCVYSYNCNIYFEKLTS